MIGGMSRLGWTVAVEVDAGGMEGRGAVVLVPAACVEGVDDFALGV